MKMELDNLDFIMPQQATITVKGNRRCRKSKSKCRVSLTVCTGSNDCQCRPCKRRKFAGRRHEAAIPLTSRVHASIPLLKRRSLPQTCLQDALFSELGDIQSSSSNIDAKEAATTKRYVCSTDPRRGYGLQFTFQSDENKTFKYEN